jgi:hypothetical protein
MSNSKWHQCAVSGQGEPLKIDVPDLAKPMYIWPVLGWVSGDIPFLAKMSNSVGHGAKAACYRCALRGVWHKPANTVRRESALHLL